MQKMAGSFINIDRASSCAVSPDLPHSEQLRGVTNVTKQFSGTIEKQTSAATYCYQEAINTGVPLGKQMTLTAENLLEKQQTTTDNLPKELVDFVLTNEKDLPSNDEERHIIEDVYDDLGKGELSHLGDRKKDTCKSKTFSEGPPTFKTFNESECWNKAYEGVKFPEIPLSAVPVKCHPPVNVSVHSSATVSLNQNDTTAIESKANTKDLHLERSSLAGEEMADIRTNFSLGTELFDNAPENTNEIFSISGTCTFEEQTCILGPGDLKMSTRTPVEDKNNRCVNALLSNNACPVDTATVSGNIPDPFCLPDSRVPQDKTFHITGNSFSQSIRNCLPQTSEKPMSQTAGNHLSKPAGYPATQKAETDASPPFQASDISPYQAMRNPVTQSVGKHLSKTAGYSMFQEVENFLFVDAGKQMPKPTGANQYKTVESFPYQAIRNPVSQVVGYSPSQTAKFPMSQEEEHSRFNTPMELIPETVSNIPFQEANISTYQALGNFWTPAEVSHVLQTEGKQMPKTTGNPSFETAGIPLYQNAVYPVSQTAGIQLLLTSGYPISQNVGNCPVQTADKLMLEIAGSSLVQTTELPVCQGAECPTSKTASNYLSQTVSYPISEKIGQTIPQIAETLMTEAANPLFETAEYPVSQNTGDNLSPMTVDPVSSVLTQTTKNTGDNLSPMTVDAVSSVLIQTTQNTGDNLSPMTVDAVSSVLAQTTQNTGDNLSPMTVDSVSSVLTETTQNTGDNLSPMTVDAVSSILTRTTQNTFPQTKGNLHLQNMGNLLLKTAYNPASVSSSPMSVCSDTSMSASKSVSAFKWLLPTPDVPDPSDKSCYTCSEKVKKAILAKIPPFKHGLGQRFHPYLQPEATHQTSLPNLPTFKLPL